MLPKYLKKNIGQWETLRAMKKRLRNHALHTVCETARCPNICECFKRGTATFMILGDICTRNCTFCSVLKKGKPSPIDPHEPKRIADMTKDLGLKYAVITSVTRDDISDGGASVFVETVNEIRKLDQNIKVEVLTPDFKGNKEAIKSIVQSKPHVFAHNLETIPRLYTSVRNKADYVRSLEVLGYIKNIDKDIFTKSGIMVGLGEKKDEVFALLKDLREVGCDLMCIGHYLKPTKGNIDIYEYIDPETFKIYEEKGYELGFKHVNSGPFVRSSYLSSEYFEK